MNQFKNQISARSEEVTVMKLDIEHNIPKKQETWGKSKDILSNEIKIQMPTVEKFRIKLKERIDHKKTNTRKTLIVTTSNSQSSSKPVSSEKSRIYMF